MAEYDWHFFEEEVHNSWRIEYKELSDDEKFEKLYLYVLELEERMEKQNEYIEKMSKLLRTVVNEQLKQSRDR